MKKLNLNTEELMPMIIFALGTMQYEYLSVAFKFALKDEFPELKGQINSSEVNSVNLELLCQKARGMASHITDMSLSIEICYSKLLKIHNLDFHNLIDQPRLKKLSDKFYTPLIDYQFPGDDDEEGFDDELFMHYHAIFIKGMFKVINASITLLQDANSFEPGIGSDYGKSIMHLYSLAVELTEHQEAVNEFDLFSLQTMYVEP